jgi:hypothetical protein
MDDSLSCLLSRVTNLEHQPPGGETVLRSGPGRRLDLALQLDEGPLGRDGRRSRRSIIFAVGGVVNVAKDRLVPRRAALVLLASYGEGKRAGPEGTRHRSRDCHAKEVGDDGRKRVREGAKKEKNEKCATAQF